MPVTSPTEGGVRGGILPGFTCTTITSKSPSEAVFIPYYELSDLRLNSYVQIVPIFPKVPLVRQLTTGFSPLSSWRCRRRLLPSPWSYCRRSGGRLGGGMSGKLEFIFHISPSCQRRGVGTALTMTIANGIGASP